MRNCGEHSSSALSQRRTGRRADGAKINEPENDGFEDDGDENNGAGARNLKIMRPKTMKLG